MGVKSKKVRWSRGKPEFTTAEEEEVVARECVVLSTLGWCSCYSTMLDYPECAEQGWKVLTHCQQPVAGACFF
jgi:hypothetical protein